MPVTRHGVNVVDASGSLMLLTETSGGDAIHLTARLDPREHGRAAVPGFYFRDTDTFRRRALRGYDHRALSECCWCETTLCGREWAVMAGGAGGPLSEYAGQAFAPSCRRCLALMDAKFPKRTADKRLPLVAEMAADMVCEYGFAEIRHVPGDQQPALRAAIRKIVRKRTSSGVQTHVYEDTIFVSCPAVYDKHATEYARAAADAASALLFGTEPGPGLPDCTLSWEQQDIS